MENGTDLKELLEYIDPGLLNYEEWAEAGMALKFEAIPAACGKTGAEGTHDGSTKGSAVKNGDPSGGTKA